MRGKEARDIISALVVTTGYVTSKSLTTNNESKSEYDTKNMTLLHGVSTATIPVYASYWYLRQSRREMRQQYEERESRVFSSQKLTSKVLGL